MCERLRSRCLVLTGRAVGFFSALPFQALPHPNARLPRFGQKITQLGACPRRRVDASLGTPAKCAATRAASREGGLGCQSFS